MGERGGVTQINEQRREMYRKPMTIVEEVDALDRWKRKDDCDQGSLQPREAYRRLEDEDEEIKFASDKQDNKQKSYRTRRDKRPFKKTNKTEDEDKEQDALLHYQKVRSIVDADNDTLQLSPEAEDELAAHRLQSAKRRTTCSVTDAE